MTIVATVLFCSCNKEVQNEPILDFKEVSVWVGKTRSVEIISSGKYEFEVLNNSVIDLTINNNSITITGLATGNSDILIKDANNIVTKLSVQSFNIEGEWKYIASGYGLENEVIIEVQDASIKAEIMNTILSNTALDENIIYQFKSDNTLKIYYKDIDGVHYDGKYEWDDFNLTLLYNGAMNDFLINPIGNTAHTIAIIQNLTTNFKYIYPNAGVEKVLFKRHLRRSDR